jgi:hypothetical protein
MGISFLILPTDFQALSFTSPPATLECWRHLASLRLKTSQYLLQKDEMPASEN